MTGPQQRMEAVEPAVVATRNAGNVPTAEMSEYMLAIRAIVNKLQSDMEYLKQRIIDLESGNRK